MKSKKTKDTDKEGKVSKILDGWQNFMVKSEVTEDLARQRALHCLKCDELKKGGILSMLKDSFVEIQGYKCGICQCPLSAKLRSINETCPINKW